MTVKIQSGFHGDTLLSRETAGFVLREIVHQTRVEIPKHSHYWRASVLFCAEISSKFAKEKLWSASL